MELLGVVAWVVAIVVLIKASKKRVKTTLYVLMAMALTLGLAFGITRIFPAVNTYAVGLGTRYLMLMVGLLTALFYSRRGRE